MLNIATYNTKYFILQKSVTRYTYVSTYEKLIDWTRNVLVLGTQATDTSVSESHIPSLGSRRSSHEDWLLSIKYA